MQFLLSTVKSSEVVLSGGAPTLAGTSVFTKHNNNMWKWDICGLMGGAFITNGWSIYHLMDGSFTT